MPIQLITTICIIVLTLALTTAIVYMTLVLKDFRETIKKSNQILDNVHAASNIVTNPMTLLANIVNGVAEVVLAGKSVSSIFKKRKDK